MNDERPGCCRMFFCFQYRSHVADYNALQLELLLPSDASHCSSRRAISLSWNACIGVWRGGLEEVTAFRASKVASLGMGSYFIWRAISQTDVNFTSYISISV
jgi:hypothetical protein